MRTRLAIIGVICGLVVVAASMLTGPTASDGSNVEPSLVGLSTSTQVETALVSLTNRERAAAGVDPLIRDATVHPIAAAWTRTMVDRDDLMHNPTLRAQFTGSEIPWTVIGENVGYGPDVENIHRAFMESEDHADNVLHPGFTRMDVAAEQSPDDLWWVTVLFWRPSP